MRYIFILFFMSLSLFAYVEDFNAYSEKSKISDLNESGISFNSDGRWIVFSNPFSVFDTPVLLEPSSSRENSPLTISFKQTQCNISLEFATDGKDSVNVVGVYNKKETYHQSFTGEDRGGSYVGKFEINTNLDSIKIYTTNKKRLLIDNVKTSSCTINSYNLSDNIVAHYSFEQNSSLSVEGVIGKGLSIDKALKLDKSRDSSVKGISLWINPNRVDTKTSILQSALKGDTPRMTLSINESGYIQLDLYDAYFSPFVSNVKIEKNSWTHLALTRDNERIKLYINAKEQGSYFVSAKLNLADEQLSLGDNDFGMVDEVRLYESNITKEQIAELYHTRSTFTQSYNNGFEDAKEFCKNSPQECGIDISTLESNSTK